ncbi:MAG: ribosome silencing factor [Calditrichia bacterium]
MTGKELSDKICNLILDKKGKDLVILDLQTLSDVADYFVIASGESDVHVRTIATHVEKELRNEGIRAWHREGMTKLSWVLLDYIEVVLHIFKPGTRDFYDLERLWADAKRIEVKDEAPANKISDEVS